MKRRIAHPGQDGFTLIELLIVIGVMSLLMAMAFRVTHTGSARAQVQGEAERLARTLVNARALAIATGSEHAVVFNIQNPPGSSGRILSNHTGGHWYRILGPSNLGYTPSKAGLIPHPARLYRELPNLGELMDQVDACWRGPIQVLPARQVRFLALGDTDEGCRKGMATASYAAATPTAVGAVGYQPTYPRPYFGVYDPATQRLHAWGGYEGPGVTFADPHRNVMGTPRDPVTPNPVPYTGFFYGADGGVLNCINISDRTYTTYRDLDIDDMLDPGESTTYTIFAKGEPRPLVNARWLDATIVFEPTGSARFLDWNAGRRAYRNAQVVIPNLPDPYTSTDPGKWPAERDSRPHGGVRDLCKHYESSRKIVSGCGTLKPACQKDFNDYPVSISDTAEVGHFHAHTNAWRISLAADADPAADTFPDAQQALDSMFPLWRVEVSQAGGVRVFEVRRDTSAFADIPRWPAAATTWQNPTEVHDNCILGFLHRKPTVAWRGSDAAKPELAGMFTESAIRGRPILDAIDTDMLVRQQWWLDP